MRRVRYLLAYDIREPRRLRQVHLVAKRYGSALQYSVFVCDLTAGELCDLRSELRDEIDGRVDSIVIIPLGEGYDSSLFEFMGARLALPKGGAAIV